MRLELFRSEYPSRDDELFRFKRIQVRLSLNKIQVTLSYTNWIRINVGLGYTALITLQAKRNYIELLKLQGKLNCLYVISPSDYVIHNRLGSNLGCAI